MASLKVVFFASVFMILYVYIGYPGLIFLLASVKRRSVRKGPYLPNVTILIAAHNEEGNIGATLENKLLLDYPREKLEIIVASDGSNDRTDDIVREYKQNGVLLHRQERRAGKTAALNAAVSKARGEVLIFSDANSIYERNALRLLVRNFNDPTVGYVTGKMVYGNPDSGFSAHGCSAFMKYEDLLRNLETRVGSIVGVDGGIDAARRELYDPMRPDQLPDFVLPLRVVEKGYRVVYEPDALLTEPALQSSEDEFSMRVRVTLRALWALRDMKHLLAVNQFRLFSLQLWSHKVLRYLCFFFLVGAYLGNLTLLTESAFYKSFFILQNVAYLGAVVSPLFKKRTVMSRILGLLTYFLLLNVAAANAFGKFLLGQKMVVWKPRKGT
jgi:cellulose synthase/poly-beta-1,6-N-acetylglucosamine synthase-like glycosyltransferase